MKNNQLKGDMTRFSMNTFEWAQLATPKGNAYNFETLVLTLEQHFSIN